MRILFCCEFYAPSVGGIQEVMRHIAERLVLRGHQITVATSRLADRSYRMLNGVTIKDFPISGNGAIGMRGNVAEYQQWVLSEAFDLVMMNMAQQWTLDALIPVLKDIRSRKILIPCGFSCLYEPLYDKYYRAMPDVLRQFDHLIFHASDYRDIRLAKRHGIAKLSIISNGASQVEFGVPQDATFRQRLGIAHEELLFLTVGAFTVAKGHGDLARAYLSADFQGRPSLLLINANTYHPDAKDVSSQPCLTTPREQSLRKGTSGMLKQIWRRITRVLMQPIDAAVHFNREFLSVVEAIHRQGSKKRVMVVNLPRTELVQAYMHADLFVFASQIECSPLVLFEAAAAGTPFLTAQVGNAEEVARWTGAGVIGPSTVDDKGYTRIDPVRFAERWVQLVQDRGQLHHMGIEGKRNWAARFTWERIAQEYEEVFQQVCGAA